MFQAFLTDEKSSSPMVFLILAVPENICVVQSWQEGRVKGRYYSAPLSVALIPPCSQLYPVEFRVYSV